MKPETEKYFAKAKTDLADAKRGPDRPRRREREITPAEADRAISSAERFIAGIAALLDSGRDG